MSDHTKEHVRRIHAIVGFLFVAIVLLASCGQRQSATPPTTPLATPTTHPLFGELQTTPTTAITQTNTTSQTTTPDESGPVKIEIAATSDHTISPFIYGLSGPPGDILQQLRPRLNSWGGNPSTRYNWKLGNAWNSARDYLYKNVDYDHQGNESASDTFMRQSAEISAAVRLAVPTLGWVAKDTTSCSFPDANGNCTDAGEASCDKPGPIADPKTTSVKTDTTFVTDWLKHLNSEGFQVQFVAMDNEPDLWGSTHYDVHPKCTTYTEIRDTYLEYATAVRQQLPDAELLGPVSCCWYFYWNSAAGAEDKRQNDNQDFLPWFLDQVRKHDEENKVRTLDVLDVHFYPEGVFNKDTDPETAALRVRSTRSLWDPTYVDESWIKEPIQLIPRMKKLIAEHYPGLKFGLSEWNWGADTHISGAIAIADVLGILGREDVYLASYWRNPEINTPGFFAFKLYTNYDGKGSSFGDQSLPATTNRPNAVTAYAAQRSSDGSTTIMLINKDLNQSQPVTLSLPMLAKSTEISVFSYDSENAEQISTNAVTLQAESGLTLPAGSITLLVIPAAQ